MVRYSYILSGEIFLESDHFIPAPVGGLSSSLSTGEAVFQLDQQRLNLSPSLNLVEEAGSEVWVDVPEM